MIPRPVLRPGTNLLIKNTIVLQYKASVIDKAQWLSAFTSLMLSPLAKTSVRPFSPNIEG